MVPAAVAGWAAAAPLIGAAVGGLADVFTGRSQQRFQERMANTAYQRAVRDMRLAGINPMLAYMKGGAESPSGALISPGRTLAEGISGAARLRLDRQVKESEIEFNRASTAKQIAEEKAVNAERMRRYGEIEVMSHQVDEIQARAASALSESGYKDALRRQVEADIHKRTFFGNLWDTANKATRGVGNALNWENVKRELLNWRPMGAKRVWHKTFKGLRESGPDSNKREDNWESEYGVSTQNE